MLKDGDPSKGLDKMDRVDLLEAGDEVDYNKLPEDLERDLLDLREVNMSWLKVKGDVDLSFPSCAFLKKSILRVSGWQMGKGVCHASSQARER